MTAARITPLGAKFGKVVALMRSTEHVGEKASALARAEAMAAEAGMTLDEAVAIGPEKPMSGFLAGFDDFCERQEPGYKARRVAERLEKYRAWRLRKAAIIARYGSEEAALEPCAREQLIRAAVEPWREPESDPRWTSKLDGWRDFSFGKAPAHVVQAICAAFPMPTTFGEAKAEFDYWEARNSELEDLLSEDGDLIGDLMLDLPTQVRADMVRDLVEHQMPTTTLADLHARFAILRASELQGNEKIEAALFRDLGAIIECQRGAREERANEGLPATEHGEPATVQPSVQARSKIADLLRECPEWSDRRIARVIGCSPTTVGKLRRSLGLAADERSVQRGGQIYKMRSSTR